MSVTAPPHERYLVLGGSGFLGSYIVDALVARGEPHVFVFDLHKPPAYYKNVRAGYFTGDVCTADRVVGVLKEVRVMCVRGASVTEVRRLGQQSSSTQSRPCTVRQTMFNRE